MDPSFFSNFYSFFAQQPVLCFLSGVVVGSCFFFLTFYLHSLILGGITTEAVQNINTLEALFLHQQNTNDRAFAILSDHINNSMFLLHASNQNILEELTHLHFDARYANISSEANLQAERILFTPFIGIT